MSACTNCHQPLHGMGLDSAGNFVPITSPARVTVVAVHPRNTTTFCKLLRQTRERQGLQRRQWGNPRSIDSVNPEGIKVS